MSCAATTLAISRMDKSFEPGQIEPKWYARWQADGAFQPAGDGDPYCILLPPPNVTGTLHMGHAFQQTVMDALIRHQRMKGARTLWQGGTDHAGIATQKIVENKLAAEGKTKYELGESESDARKAFIERVWKWKEESGSTISNQMRRIGASVDWSRERFTMDEGLSKAVRRVFVQWYRDGLLYRGRRLVNWDPVLMTAVSDLEVNSEERDGFLWLIRYNVVDPVAGGLDHVVIATTRPETMLGDVAVAVHPDDERYQLLVGKLLQLPLTDRVIPVIADDYVERDFGTGCVKITPAHDFNDWQVGTRHRLAPLVMLTLDAKIAEDASEAYRGMDRFVARKQMLAELDAQGLLIETRKHKLQVPISQRSDAVIEPMLTDQWFLDLTSETRVDGKPGPGGRKAITEPALAAVRDGEIRFVPENWTSTYNQWLENIQDWCVSRQLWWGHQIPAWYDEKGSIFVGEDEADARAHGQSVPVGMLRQDEDVLDTWFSSALWPFSTMGWPSEQPVFEGGEVVADWAKDQQFLPSAVLVTGFDIIFFWVARMVMATQYFTGKVPFREVYINAIVRDAEGQKMSKSKGNTIDPLDLIDGITLEALVEKSTASLLIPQVREKVEKRIRNDYPDGISAVGTDAMRFTFAALATYGRTINFDLKRAEGYKNFCNKLWNAARFVLMNIPDRVAAPTKPSTDAEHWILSRLSETLQQVEQQFVLYRFDLVAQALYEFVWNDYCDWFLELTKPALNGDDAAAADSTRHTLVVVLEAILRALHPITPFITEEIWQHVAPRLELEDGSVLRRPYPTATEFSTVANADAISDVQWLKALLSGVRRIRSEMNIPPAKQIPLLYAKGTPRDRARADKFAAQIAFLARAESQHWITAGDTEPASSATVIGELRVLIPLAGLIDLSAEKQRIDKEIRRIETELAKCHGKLGNANFVANAPAEVVAQENQRIADFTTTIAGLRDQAARLN